MKIINKIKEFLRSDKAYKISLILTVLVLGTVGAIVFFKSIIISIIYFIAICYGFNCVWNAAYKNGSENYLNKLMHKD